MQTMREVNVWNPPPQSSIKTQHRAARRLEGIVKVAEMLQAKEDTHART